MQVAKPILLVLILGSTGWCDVRMSGNITMSGNFKIDNVVPPAAIGFNVTQSTGRQGTGNSTVATATFPAITASGAQIQLWSTSGGDMATSCIDSGGNSYILRGGFVFGQSVMVFAATNAVPATWFKCTYGGSDNRTIIGVEISGTTQSTGTVNAGATLNAAHVNTSTMTLSGLNHITLCAVESNTASAITYTPGNGYTTILALGGASTYQLYLEQKIGSADTSCDANWSAGTATSRLLGEAWR